ncbi:Tropomodulin-1 [Irineochytrium annulatum]|nr:Tropomodulin-1 [Irineochytrium annulatum]
MQETVQTTTVTADVTKEATKKGFFGRLMDTVSGAASSAAHAVVEAGESAVEAGEATVSSTGKLIRRVLRRRVIDGVETEVFEEEEVEEDVAAPLPEEVVVVEAVEADSVKEISQDVNADVEVTEDVTVVLEETTIVEGDAAVAEPLGPAAEADNVVEVAVIESELSEEIVPANITVSEDVVTVVEETTIVTNVVSDTAEADAAVPASEIDAPAVEVVSSETPAPATEETLEVAEHYGDSLDAAAGSNVVNEVEARDQQTVVRKVIRRIVHRMVVDGSETEIVEEVEEDLDAEGTTGVSDDIVETSVIVEQPTVIKKVIRRIVHKMIVDGVETEVVEEIEEDEDVAGGAVGDSEAVVETVEEVEEPIVVTKTIRHIVHKVVVDGVETEIIEESGDDGAQDGAETLLADVTAADTETRQASQEVTPVLMAEEPDAIAVGIDSGSSSMSTSVVTRRVVRRKAVNGVEVETVDDAEAPATRIRTVRRKVLRRTIVDGTEVEVVEDAEVEVDESDKLMDTVVVEEIDAITRVVTRRIIRRTVRTIIVNDVETEVVVETSEIERSGSAEYEMVQSANPDGYKPVRSERRASRGLVNAISSYLWGGKPGAKRTSGEVAAHEAPQTPTETPQAVTDKTDAALDSAVAEIAVPTAAVSTLVTEVEVIDAKSASSDDPVVVPTPLDTLSTSSEEEGTKSSRRKSFLEYLVEEVEDSVVGAGTAVAGAFQFSKKAIETAAVEEVKATATPSPQQTPALETSTNETIAASGPTSPGVIAIPSDTVTKKKGFFQSLFNPKNAGASSKRASSTSSAFSRRSQPPAAAPVARTKEQGPPVPTSAVTASVRATNPVLEELLHTIELMASNDPELVRVDFNNCNVFTVAHGTALASALAKNTHVREVHMKNVKLQSITAFEIAKAMKKNTHLQVLNLESNVIAPAGVSIERFRGCFRENLMLSLSQIKAMAECLEFNSTLLELNLSNQKSPSGTEAESAFAKALQKNTTLVKLSLQIRDTASRANIDRSITRNKEIARKQRLASAQS